jgi:protein arginine kinase
MELRKISEHIGKWFSGSGPMSDIVISSRIRLARNIAGYEFVSNCSQESQAIILEKLKEVLMGLDLSQKVSYICVDKAGQLDKDFLVERHLISRLHAQSKALRGVVIAADEMFTAMINEEDHLRIQVLMPGLQLFQCWEQLNRIDDIIEQHIEYAFDSRLGYLTACPTNIGTGIRVSVMLHLPALKITGHLEKFFNAARDMNLAVRGLFGEGTEAVGDFFQISNQTTLGVKEEDIVKKFSDVIIPEIVGYEKLAREQLFEKKTNMINDKIYRAMGILSNAQMISSSEAMFLLSHLRLGVNLKKIDNLSIDKINELFLLTQPAHLQLNSGGPLSQDDRDELRAKIIRNCLNQN